MDKDENGRLARLSILNSYLNNIDKVTWPNDNRVTDDIRNQPIGRPAFIIFGGDLTQKGGYYNCYDLVRTNIDKVYFGLGNHDLQSEYTPAARWLGYSFVPQGNSSDYWRYQMWDFICQMHTGLKPPSPMPRTQPEFPITGANSIDDGGSSGSFDWTDHSFNYHLNFGYFSVFQLYRFGWSWNGTSYYYRPALALYGLATPAPDDMIWSQPQADSFLQIIKPYNIVALLTGHWHIPLETEAPAVTSPKIADLIRMSPGSFNIAHGIVPSTPNSGSISWFDAYSKVVEANATWVTKTGGMNDNHFFGPFVPYGKLGNTYVDLDEVLAPAGTYVTAVAFYATTAAPYS
ncbi:hypothetical protein MMC34_006671 [Xylographa carneopallida]|nr:hypothetical protein [Xylographa carneopallida]